MKAIIVDDEPKAIDLIKGYLEHFSSVELVATFRNGLKAFEFISSNPVDLVFLDINMPHLSGMSLSKMLSPEIRVVFTTAYSEYAVESYDVKAVDYLLKPISLQRFGQCMARIIDSKPEQQPQEELIQLKSGGEVHRISLNDCQFLKKEGNYMHYHTDKGVITTRQTIAEALSSLNDDFMQVHKSYIVHLSRVNAYNSWQLKVDGHEIPVGESFSSVVLECLKD